MCLRHAELFSIFGMYVVDCRQLGWHVVNNPTRIKIFCTELECAESVRTTVNGG